MPAEGVFHNLVIVSIRKRYPGHARKVMYGLWGLGLMMLAKALVVVDADVTSTTCPRSPGGCRTTSTGGATS